MVNVNILIIDTYQQTEQIRTVTQSFIIFKIFSCCFYAETVMFNNVSLFFVSHQSTIPVQK